jgi:4-pyridoxolactonase
MKQTKVYILDGGSLVIDGFHMFWNRGPAGDVRIPCYSVFISHSEGNFLFDTGFDYDHVMKVLPFEKPMQQREQTIQGGLSLAGLATGDIDYVINSHFHFDHCGGNRHLTESVTICHQLEYEAGRQCQPFERLGYSDTSFDPQLAPGGDSGDGDEADPGQGTEGQFKKVSGDVEIAKGLTLLETPGHTAGHYSLLVELPDRRPMLFAGDAVYSRQSIDMSCISSFHIDPVAGQKSLERIKEVIEQGNAEPFFGHDPESYPTYRKAPEFYS